MLLHDFDVGFRECNEGESKKDTTRECVCWGGKWNCEQFVNPQLVNPQLVNPDCSNAACSDDLNCAEGEIKVLEQGECCPICICKCYIYLI